MKKLLHSSLAIFCIALAFTLCSCVKNNTPGANPNPKPELPENLRKVDELINSIDKIKVAGPDEIIVKATVQDTAAIIYDYKDLIENKTYDAYPIKTTTTYSQTDNPMEFATLNPWSDMWPGALVQGGSIGQGIPATIPIIKKRQKGKILLSMVTGNEDMDSWSKEVEMGGASVTAAMNELLARHLAKPTPAHTGIKITQVSSAEELGLKMGINLKMFGAKLKTTFGTNWEKNKSYVAVNLNQIYFTMAYEGPDGGYAGMFTDEITTKDLTNYTGPGNPICYVSSVSYGRSFVMLYESSETIQKLQIALNAAYANQSVTSSLDVRKVLNESKCTLMQIGGNAQDGLEAVFGNFDKLKEFVLKGALVSKDSPGAPISYKILHLKDNSLVALSNTLEYKATTQQFKRVDAPNNVTIDIFNAEFTAPRPDHKNQISNYSNIELQEVMISLIDEQNKVVDKVNTLDQTFKSGFKDGVKIPIYQMTTFHKVQKSDRIKISYKFYVKTQTYPGANIGQELIEQYQLFEFNTSLNKWQSVEDRKNAFAELPLTRKVGNATFDFKLTYRFACDGMIYPLAK